MWLPAPVTLIRNTYAAAMAPTQKWIWKMAFRSGDFSG
jgi:hypothetical protein